MAECAYCGDEISGRPVVREDKKYCTKECADLDEEEFDEDDELEDEDNEEGDDEEEGDEEQGEEEDR